MIILEKAIVDFQDFLAVARGKREADMYIEGGSLVNVFTGEIYPANVAVFQGKIAYVGGNRAMVGPRTEVIDASGYYLCPGFIEAHSHPWMVYTPASMVKAALPLGTTTFVCDDLFFFVCLGAESFIKLIRALEGLPARLYWVARIAHQSPDLDEQEIFSVSNLVRVFDDPRVIKVGEITRWPLLVEGDQSVLQKIILAKERRLGFEAHTAGCSYDRLNVVAAAGMESCHEAITAEEVVQRLRLGLWTILRHSSLRPDLRELLRAVREWKVDTERLLFTTDGSSPGFLMREGWMDGVLRTAVKEGLHPLIAIKMATINPAVYLGLDREIGSIAPGRQADILFLPDLESFKPRMVIVGGKVVAVEGRVCVPVSEPDWMSLGFLTKVPPRELVSNSSLYGVPAVEPTVFPVIEVISAAITRPKEMTFKPRDGLLEREGNVLYCTLINRLGKWVSSGFVEGVGRIEGLATTFVTSFDLLVLGLDRSSMALAAGHVVEMGGGIAVVEGGRVVFEMPLKCGGMMSEGSFEEVAAKVEELEGRAREWGYPYNDILYTLLFLACDFLPGLRITASGIYDVKSRRVLFPSRRI